MWNDSSIFWAVRLRDMRAHIHRALINWDFVVIRPLRLTQNPNVWMVIYHFDWMRLIVVPDSGCCPRVNLLFATLVAVCHRSMLDVFALDRVWPKRNCYCLMTHRHLVSLCVIATMFRLSIDPIYRTLCLPQTKNETKKWKRKKIL